MASLYQAPDYDENKYRSGLTQLNADYDNQKTTFANAQEQNRATQLAEAQKTQQSNLRNAYINRLQNEKKMNQNLAMSGIRGGMTETANLNLMNQYGQARASANTDYANSVNQINQNIDKSILDFNMDLESRRAQAIQDQANARWQAEREDQTNEVARQTEYWSNYYTNFYSGYSKKDAKKAYKTLAEQYNKTTDPMARLKIEQAMSAVKGRLGVIANK